jgi:7,8-dihydropterin-6-yl-methyl-4-(beta-D-ribofuranosyl)aminobenzene 5'-phosphate synthase
VPGCAHAGIINTILYSHQVIGIKTVYAVLGGFYLAGKENISQTVKELKKIPKTDSLPTAQASEASAP